MTIETPVAQPPQTSYDDWRTRRWTAAGRLLVLLWLVVTLAVLTVGERRSDLGSLHGGLADGSVKQVEVTGLPRNGVSGGFATVRLGWETRFLNRYTEILVVSPGGSERPTNSEDLPVVVGDPVAVLEELQPGVEILREEFWAGTSFEAAGWSLRGRASIFVGPLWLITLLLVMSGPQPWRATRWAWVWVVLAAPIVGVLAYLLLGGPLGAGRPAHRARRLTGGWAFLIAVFVLGGFGAA